MHKVPPALLAAVEKEARQLEDDIARHRVLVSPDVRRIVTALVRYFDSLG
jgi:hypothetical protein